MKEERLGLAQEGRAVVEERVPPGQLTLGAGGSSDRGPVPALVPVGTLSVTGVFTVGAGRNPVGDVAELGS